MKPGTRVLITLNDREGTVVARPARCPESFEGDQLIYAVVDGADLVSNWRAQYVKEQGENGKR